jgi:hypothetical protein
MKKPELKTIQRYDWVECMQYIEEKYGYECRLQIGDFAARDEPHNGTEIELVFDDYIDANGNIFEDWFENHDKEYHECVRIMAKEFGAAATYWYWW